MDEDRVFKALGNASRQQLLDRLREKSGLTLGALCEGHDMSRQAIAKHLKLLEDVNLVVTKKHGREKLHYLKFRTDW
jgi:DNA-binding transcriptional ArsR family regulator